MNRHITTEILSAYLDSELGVAEAARIETHCENCADCRARLLAIRRVARSLSSLGTVAPPAALRAQVRRRIEFEPLPLRQRWLARLRWLFELPARPAWRSTAAALFALVASTFLLNEGLQRNQGTGPLGHGAAAGQVKVVTYLGEAPFPGPQTTGEVDGLKFVWTEEAGWVQRGLEGERPATRVDVTSPEGRELLRRFSDLQFLLADGDSVVLRYNLETVELRADKGGRQSTEGIAQPRIGAGLDLQARFV
jgi:hypothetical protein